MSLINKWVLYPCSYVNYIRILRFWRKIGILQFWQKSVFFWFWQKIGVLCFWRKITVLRFWKKMRFCSLTEIFSSLAGILYFSLLVKKCVFAVWTDICIFPFFGGNLYFFGLGGKLCFSRRSLKPVTALVWRFSDLVWSFLVCTDSSATIRCSRMPCKERDCWDPMVLQNPFYCVVMLKKKVKFIFSI